MEANQFLEQYLVNRKGTDCLKWDDLGAQFGEPDLIGMWIADAEFKTCDEILDALIERTRHGVFGYAKEPEGYYEAFSDWMERHHNWPVNQEWIRFSTGVVTAIAWSILAFTKPGDACMILTPVYYPFHNVVTYNDRRLVAVDLDYHDGYFTMDFEAIEEAIVKNDVKIFLLCSPHNPAGRVWTEEELEKVMDICRKHDVLIVSDEIHQDIILSGQSFIPAALIGSGKYNDHLIVLSSASKTFNLAGLVHSHIVIPDPELRHRYDEFARGVNRTSLNIPGMTTAMTGYRYGDDWLDGMLKVIEDNDDYLRTTLAERAPEITVCCLEGTYLVMLDLRKVVSKENIRHFVQDQCRLAVDYGEVFGENYEGFIRLNLATDPKYVHQAVNNILNELGR